jgi:solute carrier family 25 (peroxisomal adenine nucleotide transporter), member 17
MVSTALQIYRQFGAAAFVRGIEISVLQSAIEKGLYFVSYTLLKKLHRHFYKATNTTTTYMYLLYGYISGWVYLPITVPIDAWKTQIQTCKSHATNDKGSNNTTQSQMDILFSMINDPSYNFYKGLSAYFVLCWKPAIQYWIYERLKILLLTNKQRHSARNTTSRPHKQQQLTNVESFILGMVARTISTIVVYPYIRAKVLLQTKQLPVTATRSSLPCNDQSNNHMQSRQNCSDDAIPVVARSIATSKSSLDRTLFQHPWNRKTIDNICQLYYGIGPELTRGILSAAIMLMMKEHIVQYALVVQQWNKTKRDEESIFPNNELSQALK